MSDVVPIRDYVDARMAEQEKRWVDRFDSTLRAVETAANQLDARLEGMNEFREAIKDQANRMATKAELQKVDTAVRDLQRAKAHWDGRLVVIASVVGGAFGVAAALLVRLLP